MNTMKISLADRVYDTLENGILDGKYEQGEYLTEARLSDELGVSRTPIREALRRLGQDGLIEETGKGALVVGVAAGEIAVIYEMRARIEGYAAGLFTERVTEGQLKELRDNIELQDFYCAKTAAAESSGNLDSRFHEIIYSGCGSRVLEDTLSSLNKKARRYRRVSYEDPRRSKNAAAEHRAIYDAVFAGDAAKAETLMTLHIHNACESIITHMGTKEI
jgi:DNA-binding GntR family transcriptional regulator